MIQWWQILLLTLYSAYQICDELTIVSSAGSPVFAGFITGLIMGDVTTGLLIGGNLQLFVLGVGTSVVLLVSTQLLVRFLRQPSLFHKELIQHLRLQQSLCQWQLS